MPPFRASLTTWDQRFQIKGQDSPGASAWPVFLSRAKAQRRGGWNSKANIPLSPIARQGENRSGMEVGTPFPVAFQATRWYRRIRIAPTATRGTDARPRTRIATKSIFAHISCEGLRQPLESRERTT